MAAAIRDRPVLVIENDLDAPVGRLGDWLREAGAELERARRPSRRSRCRPTWPATPALVVLGGG